METSVLAEQLRAFAQADGGTELIVQPEPGRTSFRFDRDPDDPEHTMHWEALPRVPATGAPLSEAQSGWLTRLGFRWSNGRFVRTVAAPHSLESARLIAGMISFLLERVYGVSPDATVTIRSGGKA